MKIRKRDMGIENEKLYIILASKSERRKAILKKNAFDFEIYVPHTEEKDIIGKKYSEELVEECARKKAEAAYQELSKGSQSMPEHMKTMQELAHTIIVSCDTVVVNNGIIIGKPKDREDAKFDFVENIEGSMDNVVGFPIEIFKEMLKKIY